VELRDENNIAALKEKAYYLEVINSFASKLLLLTTVDEVLWAVAKHAVAQLHFSDCIIYFIDENNEYLIQRAAHGLKNPKDLDIENPIRIKIGEGICGHVAKSGKPEIVINTQLDKRYIVDDIPRLSEITVPILSDGKVVGIIDSEHKDVGFYSNKHLEILTTIASMASSKINEAIVQEKLKKSYELLEEKVEEKTKKLQNALDELQLSYDEITKSNIEKETLLKEIHHRVKNNLQILSSLLNIHSNNAENNSEREVFNDCKNRILCMSSIHEQLYSNTDYSEIDLHEYIIEISNNLLLSYNAIDQVKLILDLEKLSIKLESSIPVGLILNELIVNAIKYAFPQGSGELGIRLFRNGNRISIEVEDNGVGFDVNKEKNSIGLELIDTLVLQLDGIIDLQSSNKGTRCKFSFLV